MNEITISDIFIGKARPYGPNGEASAIQKQSIRQAVQVEINGIVGDEQGDRLYHGGADKALHYYPAQHYAMWRAQFGPAASPAFQPGGFGENISGTGLTEHQVCIADVFELGNCIVQVSQARQPCWKLNLRFGYEHMARLTQDSLRTGWYFRVLKAGMTTAGDRLRLIDRQRADWPLARLLHYLYLDTMNRAALESMSTLAELTPSWRKLAQTRLQNGSLEDWSPRLDNPRSPGLPSKLHHKKIEQGTHCR